MESNTQENFICPLCGGKLLWMPVSKIFVCEHCKQSLSEDAKFYLRNENTPREKSNGNAAAMREALEAARDLLLPQCNGGTAFAKACGETVNKIMDALSALPHNGDVGTPEEQAERHTRFCLGQRWGCRRCPVHHKEHNACVLAWAQMPYEEGGEDHG